MIGEEQKVITIKLKIKPSEERNVKKSKCGQ